MDKITKDLLKRMPKSGEGVKPEPYSPGNILWGEDDIIDMAYDIAPKIYRAYKNNWLGTNYTEDDFKQDAAMKMLKLFRDGYLDKTNPYMSVIIKKLLSGYFLLNRTKKASKSRRLSKVRLPDDKLDDYNQDELDQEKVETLNYYIQKGSDILASIIKKLDNEPYPSRKYHYTGELNNNPVEFSERNLAALYFGGFDFEDLKRVYDVSRDKILLKFRIFERRFKNMINKVLDAIAVLEEEEIHSVAMFLKRNFGYDTEDLLS